MQNQITIFCDGASKGNPGPGGYGAVLVVGDKVKELGGAEKETTNNRMELTGAIKAFETLEKLKVKNYEVNVYTDSRYVINGITKWVFAWQKNNWQTKAKEDVLNKDLWEMLAKLEKDKKIKWNYVGGHIGVAGNERCDEIASALASGEKVNFYNGSLADYKLNILDLGHDDAKKSLKQSSSSKKSNSKIKAYSYLSLIKGVLYKDQTWAECEKRVKGVSGTKYQKAISPEHEKEIIASWGL
jgi:ribonuclease HI